jgi:hypothetical protein
MKTDSEKRLRKIVLESHEVSAVYGGFEIRVIDRSLFPWYHLFDQLIEISQVVWVYEKADKIYSFKPGAP